MKPTAKVIPMPANEIAPLTPPECDLRSFPFMALDVVRLRDSEIAACEDPEAFRCAVLLWCASWHQVPAASLPNDEAKLARLAGYGRDVTSFKNARDVGGMRGWVLCSDGRLYHPVVAEKAMEAWEFKTKQRDRTRKATEARVQASNKSTKRPNVTLVSTSTVAKTDTKAETTTVAADVTMPVTESIGQDRTGKDRTEKESVADSRSEAARATSNGHDHPDGLKPGDWPRVGDPPDRWLHLSDKSEVDHAMVRHPVVGGYYLDVAAAAALNAAKINPAKFRGDWRPLMAWLSDGITSKQIREAIASIASRPGYNPTKIGSLAYFDKAVRAAEGSTP